VTDHPSELVLQRFAQADLGEHLAAHVAEHLDACPRCANLVRSADPLARMFASVDDPPVPDDLLAFVIDLAAQPSLAAAPRGADLAAPPADVRPATTAQTAASFHGLSGSGGRGARELDPGHMDPHPLPVAARVGVDSSPPGSLGAYSAAGSSSGSPAPSAGPPHGPPDGASNPAAHTATVDVAVTAANRDPVQVLVGLLMLGVAGATAVGSSLDPARIASFARLWRALHLALEHAMPDVASALSVALSSLLIVGAAWTVASRRFDAEPLRFTSGGRA
jgi:hypothetical protein